MQKPSRRRRVSVTNTTASCQCRDDSPSCPFSSSSLFLSYSSFSTLSSTLFLSLRPHPSSAILSFSTQFLHQISQFDFIFFTFFTSTTLIFHHFLIFHPHSLNLTSLNLNLTFFSLKIRPLQGVLRPFYHQIPPPHTLSFILHPY